MGWPSWRYGPGGQAKVFEREEDVPAGWVDHPAGVRPAEDKPRRGRPRKVNG